MNSYNDEMNFPEFIKENDDEESLYQYDDEIDE